MLTLSGYIYFLPGKKQNFNQKTIQNKAINDGKKQQRAMKVVQHPGGLAQHKAAAAAATIQNSGTINGEHGGIVGAGAGAAPPSCSKGTPGKVINGVVSI